MFDLTPGTSCRGAEDADPGTGLVPLGDMVISLERVRRPRRKEYGHCQPAGARRIWPSTRCSTCWGTTTWTRGPRRPQMRAREEAILGELGIGR